MAYWMPGSTSLRANTDLNPRRDTAEKMNASAMKTPKLTTEAIVTAVPPITKRVRSREGISSRDWTRATDGTEPESDKTPSVRPRVRRWLRPSVP